MLFTGVPGSIAMRARKNAAVTETKPQRICPAIFFIVRIVSRRRFLPRKRQETGDRSRETEFSRQAAGGAPAIVLYRMRRRYADRSCFTKLLECSWRAAAVALLLVPPRPTK